VEELLVEDGFLSLVFDEVFPKLDNPKINAIQINLVGPHTAHAVPGGPYFGVDTQKKDEAKIRLPPPPP
jgi:hypothetical protein